MREIDGKASVHGFGIYGTERLDVGRDIGDSDIKRRLFLVKIDGVVKVLCGNGIDGTKRKVAQIFSVGVPGSINRFAKVLGLVQDTLVELVMPVKQGQGD